MSTKSSIAYESPYSEPKSDLDFHLYHEMDESTAVYLRFVTDRGCAHCRRPSDEKTIRIPIAIWAKITAAEVLEREKAQRPTTMEFEEEGRKPSKRRKK